MASRKINLRFLNLTSPASLWKLFKKAFADLHSSLRLPATNTPSRNMKVPSPWPSAVRDRPIDRWIKTQSTFLRKMSSVLLPLPRISHRPFCSAISVLNLDVDSAVTEALDELRMSLLRNSANRAQWTRASATAASDVRGLLRGFHGDSRTPYDGHGHPL